MTSKPTRLLEQAHAELDVLWRAGKPGLRAAEAAFRGEMDEYWGPAFERFEELFYFYVDIAEMLSRQCHNENGLWAIDLTSGVPPPGGWLSQAVHVTNMKTVRTSLAALQLAKAGMCNDAYALCRVLYEVYLVRGFIVQHMDALLVAQRYFDHVAVTEERTKRSMEPWLSEEERASIRDERNDPGSGINRLKQKYGSEWTYFRKDYGWAFPNREDRNGTIVASPNLEDLARFVTKSGGHHYVYRKASQQLHASVAGTLGFGSWDEVPIAPVLRGVDTILRYVAPWIRDAGFTSLEVMARDDEQALGLEEADQACVDLLAKLTDELDDAVEDCRRRVRERQKSDLGKRDNMYETLRREKLLGIRRGQDDGTESGWEALSESLRRGEGGPS